MRETIEAFHHWASDHQVAILVTLACSCAAIFIFAIVAAMITGKRYDDELPPVDDEYF